MPVSQDIQKQLKNLSDEELEELKSKVMGFQSASTGLLAGAEGMLLASQGKGLSESRILNPKTTDIEQFLQQEKLKNITDPTRRKSQIELEEIERKRKEQEEGGIKETGEAGDISNLGSGEEISEKAPPMFINVPKGENQYGVMEYETRENPAFKLWEKKQDKRMESDVKKESALKEIENYFIVDDIIQEARGEGLGRFESGLKLKYEGLKQESPTGIAQAQLSKARKNLRVTIARLKDVGNLNTTEQLAAENLIPADFDSKELAAIKKAYLFELAKALDDNDSNGIRNIVNRWSKEGLYSSSDKDNKQLTVPEVGSSFQGQKVINVERIE